jgi:broad specificity phosphatase PhoE
VSTERQQVWLVRHGATDWSQSGQHTGRTDVPLNDEGRKQARALARRLAGREFALVLTSPLKRAVETCSIAGLGDVAEQEANLREWDYGDYEGRTTAEIREHDEGWTVWLGPVPNGETLEQVGARADRVVDRVLAADGDAVLFAHGHILRVLAARWVRLGPEGGSLLALDTATLSVLGFERETRVVRQWNEDAYLLPVPL